MMPESLLILVIVTLAIAGFLAWALVAGLGNPRPQVEPEGWPFGFTIIESPYVPSDTALLAAWRTEQRLAYSVMRPESFVKITNIGA